MTAVQLAKRVQIRQSSLTELEGSEARGTITLNSLRKAAHALDCELVYALVPRRSLEETLLGRIRQFARERVERVAHTMRLEDQSLPAEHVERQIEDLAKQLFEKPPRNLWD